MNNIKNKIFIFGLTSILLGCSQSATSVFSKDPIYAQNIQYSKIIKSVENENINAIFNITYLNSVDKSIWNNDKQNFLIGTYFFDSNETNFQLYLNDKKQVSTKKVSKNDPLYKNIAFRNSWANYNIVSFEDIENIKNLTITYTHPKYKTISTSFLKE